MLRALEEDLRRVRQALLEMAGGVEEMIDTALSALENWDPRAAERVIQADRGVDQMEKEIDETCLRTLALQEPKAGDFRFLVAVQRIVGDLERMGDSAVNMAQAALRLQQEPRERPYAGLPQLGEMVLEMVHSSCDALVRGDAGLARRVCAGDDEVDGLYQRLFGELVGCMIEERKSVEKALQWLLVAKNLERIGDHATNIAEDVIYFLEARDVRHSRPKEVPEAVFPPLRSV